ncbi:MAG TPA: helix-turn-helix transcriptional regulator [Conexibacter sp.]|nr:helix-turn-helix transcriptional regulator [Conexibacter sp.]
MSARPTTAQQATQRFAANLRRARDRAGLTQEELADEADLHRTAISFLERGEREPRLWTLVKLSYALKIPPSELLEDLA